MGRCLGSSRRGSRRRCGGSASTLDRWRSATAQGARRASLLHGSPSSQETAVLWQTPFWHEPVGAGVAVAAERAVGLTAAGGAADVVGVGCRRAGSEEESVVQGRRRRTRTARRRRGRSCRTPHQAVPLPSAHLVPAGSGSPTAHGQAAGSSALTQPRNDAAVARAIVAVVAVECRSSSRRRSGSGLRSYRCPESLHGCRPAPPGGDIRPSDRRCRSCRSFHPRTANRSGSIGNPSRGRTNRRCRRCRRCSSSAGGCRCPRGRRPCCRRCRRSRRRSR
jgi:hypothetical protein